MTSQNNEKPKEKCPPEIAGTAGRCITCPREFPSFHLECRESLRQIESGKPDTKLIEGSP